MVASDRVTRPISTTCVVARHRQPGLAGSHSAGLQRPDVTCDLCLVENRSGQDRGGADLLGCDHSMKRSRRACFGPAKVSVLFPTPAFWADETVPMRIVKARRSALAASTVVGMIEHSETRFAAVVYNPIKVDLEALKAAVVKHEATGGWGATLWLPTSEEDAGQGQTKEALESGASMVIAAGGDGTVRAVAEAMVDGDASLALLPSGTGNLLARNLHLTLGDLDHSLETAFEGVDRSVDVGRIEIERDDRSKSRHVFVVMAGLGIDAKMLAATSDELKKHIGWLAYVGALMTALRDKNQLRLRYSLDGSPTRAIRAHTIIVGNCGLLPANILLLPDAAVDDGLFDIVLLRPKGIFGWAQIIGKVLWENGVLRRSEAGRKLLSLTKDARALRYVKGREVILRLDRAHDIELDGDSFGTALALKTWVDAGGLTVRVPAGS
jgi:diacylglycerol kinase (ATP)